MKKILLLSTLFLTPAAFAQSTNVRVNPLGLLIGLFNADIDFKVTDTVTVGPQLSYLNWSLGSTSVKAYGIGARANFYLSGPVFTDGWYAAPAVAMAFASAKNSTDSASYSAVNVSGLFGYQWVWASGFNINLGFGASYSARPSSVDGIDISGLSAVTPAIEFTLGKTF